MNLFLIIFPVATKLVQVWEEKALEQEVRTELVVPVSNKKFSDLPAASTCTLGSSPMMAIQAGWLEWATSVLLNHHEERLGT